QARKAATARERLDALLELFLRVYQRRRRQHEHRVLLGQSARDFAVIEIGEAGADRHRSRRAVAQHEHDVASAEFIARALHAATATTASAPWPRNCANTWRNMACSAALSCPPENRLRIAPWTCSADTPARSGICRPSGSVSIACDCAGLPLCGGCGSARVPPPPIDALPESPRSVCGEGEVCAAWASCCSTCCGSSPSTCAADETSVWVRNAALG